MEIRKKVSLFLALPPDTHLTTALLVELILARIIFASELAKPPARRFPVPNSFLFELRCGEKMVIKKKPFLSPTFSFPLNYWDRNSIVNYLSCNCNATRAESQLICLLCLSLGKL